MTNAVTGRLKCQSHIRPVTCQKRPTALTYTATLSHPSSNSNVYTWLAVQEDAHQCTVTLDSTMRQFDNQQPPQLTADTCMHRNIRLSTMSLTPSENEWTCRRGKNESGRARCYMYVARMVIDLFHRGRALYKSDNTYTAAISRRCTLQRAQPQ